MGTKFEVSNAGVVDFQQNGTLELVIEQGTVAPSGVEGQLFWRTDLKQLFIHNGTVFTSISDVSGGWVDDGVVVRLETITDEVGIGTTSPESTLHVEGSLSVKVTSTSASVAAGDEGVLLVDASGGARTITLPAAASSTSRVYHIKKTDSSSNAVTIDGNAAETIDGSTTQDINLPNESLTIACDGSNWSIV